MIAFPGDELERAKKLVAPRIEAAIAEVEKLGRPGRKFLEDYTVRNDRDRGGVHG